ncbi:MAG: TlpA family protein disulfide reductase [Proteobacteria bacterium]|nr:MAG: TlpA family protein disulfide reductase [Pseudomonadota bacterium]
MESIMGRLYILILTLATTALMSSACTRGSDSAPPAALKRITSEELKRLTANAGKPSVINLWATWCEPCKTEMPEFVKFLKSPAGKQVNFVLISADDLEDHAKAANFLKQAGMAAQLDGSSYQLSEDAETFGKAWSPTWSATLPVTFITDAKGQIKTFWIGETNQILLEERLQKALAAPATGPALQRHAK